MISPHFLFKIRPMAGVFTGTFDKKKPEKISPASTFISTIEYNPQENTMDITFKSGTKMRYLEVSPVTYLSFKQSPNLDSFYARAIKGNLSSVKLVDASIGREKSAPLDQIKKDKKLNEGIKRQQNRNERIAGTVNRAFAAV